MVSAEPPPAVRARQAAAVLADGTDPDAPAILAMPRGELAGELLAAYSKLRLNDLCVSGSVRSTLSRLIREQRARETLARAGLHPARTLLACGLSGSGRTRSAATIASELDLPLFMLRPDRLVSEGDDRKLGLDKVVSAIGATRGVYLLHHFDIEAGADRGVDRGEVLERFLMHVKVEQLKSPAVDSIVIVCAHSPADVGEAVADFDAVLEFDLPDSAMAQYLIRSVAGRWLPQRMRWTWILDAAAGLRQGQIVAAAEEVVRSALLSPERIDALAILLEALRSQRRRQSPPIRRRATQVPPPRIPEVSAADPLWSTRSEA